MFVLPPTTWEDTLKVIKTFIVIFTQSSPSLEGLLSGSLWDSLPSRRTGHFAIPRSQGRAGWPVGNRGAGQCTLCHPWQ